MILGYPLLPNRKNSCACNHSRFPHCSHIPHMVIPSNVPLLVSHIPRLLSFMHAVPVKFHSKSNLSSVPSPGCPIPRLSSSSSIPSLKYPIPRVSHSSSIPSLEYPIPQVSRPSIIPSLEGPTPWGSHPLRVPSLEGPILRVSPLMRVPSFVSPLPKTSLPWVYIPRSHIAVYMQLTYRTQETVYGSSIHVRIVHYSCFDHICWSADCCSDQSWAATRKKNYNEQLKGNVNYINRLK